MGSLSQCARQRNGLLRQIRNLNSILSLHGDKKSLDEACARFVGSAAVQLYHLCQDAADPTLKWSAENEYNMRVGRGFEAIDFRLECQTIKFWKRKKLSGGSRIVCKLPAELKMFHRIGLDLLHALHRPPPDAICDWKGRGATAAVRRLIQGLHSDSQYVVLADVTKCFDSVNVEAVAELDLLPVEFFRSVALPTNGFAFQRCPDGLLRGLRYGLNANESVPTGLLQGSPMSNALFALLVRDIPVWAGTTLTLSSYSDNVGVVADSEEQAQMAADGLVRYFSDHRAGPFSLRTEIRPVREPFDFLGYQIHVEADGRPFIDINLANWTRHMARIEQSAEDPSKIDQAIRAMLSFPLMTPAAREIMEGILHEGVRVQNEAL